MLVALTCLSLTGCSTLPKRSFVSSVDPASLDDTAFLHYLASVPTVTVVEAARGVLLLRGDTDRWSTHLERRNELLRIGAIRQQWGLAPDDTLDMGTLGYMLRVICDLSPSVNERVATVTGLGDRRYALRRCIDAGILPYKGAGQAVRGGELVAAIVKAEKFVNPAAPSPDVEPTTKTP